MGPGIESYGKHSLKEVEHSSGLRSELGIQWRIYWWILHYREVDLSCGFASIYSRFIDEFWKIISDSGETYINRFRISLWSFLSFAPFWPSAHPSLSLFVPVPSAWSSRIRKQSVVWDHLTPPRGPRWLWVPNLEVTWVRVVPIQKKTLFYVKLPVESRDDIVFWIWEIVIEILIEIFGKSHQICRI